MSNITTNNAKQNGVWLCNPCLECINCTPESDCIFFEPFEFDQINIVEYDIDSRKWVKPTGRKEAILGEVFTFQVDVDDFPLEDHYFGPIYETQTYGVSFNGFPIERHFLENYMHLDVKIVAFEYYDKSNTSGWSRYEIERYEVISLDFAKDINGDYYKSPSDEDIKILEKIKNHYYL